MTFLIFKIKFHRLSFSRPFFFSVEQMYTTKAANGKPNTDSTVSSPLSLPPTPQQQNQNRHQVQEETCIIFLVDGSGSVTEDDFNCMTTFMLTAAELIKTTKTPYQKVHLGVIQFSNEVRVELPPTEIKGNFDLAAGNDKTGGGGGGDGNTNIEGDEEGDADEILFESAVEHMLRINGGTNIAAAIQKAGQLFKTLTLSNNEENGSPSARPSNCKKVIALLTDGRIDSFQSHEAKEITARLVDEQGNVALHAFGVGRGVDRVELLRIVGGACPSGEDAANRYLPLMVLEDAPW
jgi:uncharacterized protein YegL